MRLPMITATVFNNGDNTQIVIIPNKYRISIKEIKNPLCKEKYGINYNYAFC